MHLPVEQVIVDSNPSCSAMNKELFQKYVDLIMSMSLDMKNDTIDESHYCNMLELAIEKMCVNIAGGEFKNGSFE